MQTTSNPNLSDRDARKTVAPIAPGAEWVRPADCRALFGISRSSLYELIATGKVQSVCLRKRGGKSGARLVSADSLRAYIGSFLPQKGGAA